MGNSKAEINPFTYDLQLVTEDILSGANHIQSSESFEIPLRRQMIIHGTLNLEGSLDLKGSLVLLGSDFQGNQQNENPYVTKTADYTATLFDKIILVDASSNTVTITLPAAATADGKEYYIKATDATNAITIDGNGSELVEDAITQTLAVGEVMKIISDKNQWWVL